MALNPKHQGLQKWWRRGGGRRFWRRFRGGELQLADTHLTYMKKKKEKKQRPLVTSSLNIYPNEEDGGRRRGRIPSGHLSRHGDKASAAVGARPAKSRDPLRLYVPITAHHMKSAPSIIIPAGRHQSCLRRAPTRGGAVISGLD